MSVPASDVALGSQLTFRFFHATGHFERRISFGYDADLTQVRAEFDGEHLRIIVPRQPMPMTFWGSRS